MKRLRDEKGKFIATTKFCKNKSCANARLQMQKNFLSVSNQNALNNFLAWLFIVVSIFEFAIILGLTL